MALTRHDASKVMLGSHGSSDFVSSCHDVDPASFPAGRAVRGKSDGKISLSSADGQLIGVSLGADLSDTKKTSVCRSGNDIPLEIGGFNYLTKDELTFYTKRNVVVSIAFIDQVVAAGSEAVTVTGDDDAGYLISMNMDVLSTATQCKTALDAKAEALALIETIITGTAGNAQAAFAEDAIDGVLATIGGAVRVSNSTGKAVASGGTLTGAQYASNAKTGIAIDGTEGTPVALIDMGGGL